ncbi:hypothetical protein [Leifsonia poae]|uniref:hypothetical protein n=1 Tax=Leifsonia poae TaxID=110933 RepID=UPI001CBB7089|nr:hypothetical protein [Leifsonia poae]
MTLREIADELYGVPAAAFTAARAAAAAGTGDKRLAEQILRLRKPSAAAAAVNRLAREEPELIEALLAVGERMRAAVGSGDRAEIRALTGERRRLLQKAVDRTGGSAAVHRTVEETLQATAIDPAAAAAVRSGLLLRALASTGLDPVELSDAMALPVGPDAHPLARPQTTQTPEAPHSPEPNTAPGVTAARRRERKRRIRVAETALERSRSAAEALDAELAEEVDHRTALEVERDDLTRRLEHTRDELAEARATERELRSRISRAHSAVRAGERELRTAREQPES